MALLNKPNAEALVEGTKYDENKVRLDLFPGDSLFAISEILTFGAKKYADRNWEKGMKWSRPFGALMRHMWAWWMGENFDKETGKSHLWHAGCCIVFLIAYEARGMRDFDDRPVGKLKAVLTANMDDDTSNAGFPG